jgi:hypothetical protein
MTAILVSWSQRRANTRTRSRISSTVHRSLPRFGIPAGYGIWESPPLFGRGERMCSPARGLWPTRSSGDARRGLEKRATGQGCAAREPRPVCIGKLVTPPGFEPGLPP